MTSESFSSERDVESPEEIVRFPGGKQVSGPKIEVNLAAS